MATWIYEARDQQGQAVRGKHEAPDRQSALEALRAQNLFLTRLEAEKSARPSLLSVMTATPKAANSQTPSERPTVSGPGASSPRPDVPFAPPARPGEGAAPSARIATGVSAVASVPPIERQPFLRASNQALGTFYSQLASLLHSGVSLGASLESLAKYAQSSALRSAAGQMREQVMSGQPLSLSMRAFPGLFSPLVLGIVEAGERGGFMESAFSRLAEYAERDYALQQAIKSQTWYPKLLVFAAILIPGVVPLYLRGFNAFVRQVGPPLFVIALLFIMWLAWRKFSAALTTADPVRRFWDGFKLYLPIGGKIARGLATAKFCRALSALYSAGVGMPAAIKLAGEASGNEALSQRAREIVPRLQNGESLTDCLPQIGRFHPMALQMVAVGEQSGELDLQLDKAASFLEGDAETAIRQAIPVLGILLFLAIAVYIGMQVISFYSGYINTLSSYEQ